MDIETIRDQIAGFEAKRKQLEQAEKLFLRAQGMKIEEEKIRDGLAGKEKALQDKRDAIRELRIQKAVAVGASIQALSVKMGEVLPYGKAIFEIEDGKVSILWDNKPYNALSGGEKVIFDGALTHALEADVLIYEAAEVDESNLSALLHQLAKADTQVIVNTWSVPTSIPEEFQVVSLFPEALEVESVDANTKA